MPSKYDKVLPGLKKAPPADLSFQQKVDKAKAEIGNRIEIVDGQPCVVGRKTAPELAFEYAALCAEDARVKAHQEDVNVRFEAVTQLLTASQEAAEPEWGKYGVAENALRLPTGDTLRVQPEPYGQVKDKEAFREWCLANGYERQLQLWPSTMNAVCKERLLEGQPLPDGCDVFIKTKIVYASAPAKKEKS